jgi:hypothetical protein
MSDGQSKGEFLKAKMENMARWVTGEVGQENLSVDIIAGITGRSALEVTVLCGALEANNNLAIHRDWSGLVRLLEANHAPSELQEVVVSVKHRPQMHDKFWRYITCFIEVSAQ